MNVGEIYYPSILGATIFNYDFVIELYLGGKKYGGKSLNIHMYLKFLLILCIVFSCQDAKIEVEAGIPMVVGR